MTTLVYRLMVVVGAGFLGACATAEPTQSAALASDESASTDAAAGDAETAAADADEDYDPDKIICKTKKSTGTRIGRYKDCRTAEQWRRSGSNASRAIGSMINDMTKVPSSQD